MQKSQEARIRALALDLLAIVDRRDRQALKQSEALATVPAKRKPAPQPTDIAREVAYGRVVMPLMELPAAAERSRILEHRRVMRERRNGESIVDNWGEAGEMAAFETQERARWNRAASMLRNGVGEGNVAIACDLTADEINNLAPQRVEISC
jgi:hypothetical protein